MTAFGRPVEPDSAGSGNRIRPDLLVRRRQRAEGPASSAASIVTDRPGIWASPTISASPGAVVSARSNAGVSNAATRPGVNRPITYRSLPKSCETCEYAGDIGQYGTPAHRAARPSIKCSILLSGKNENRPLGRQPARMQPSRRNTLHARKHVPITHLRLQHHRRRAARSTHDPVPCSPSTPAYPSNAPDIFPVRLADAATGFRPRAARRPSETARASIMSPCSR